MMKQACKTNLGWQLWGALIAGVLVISPSNTLAQTGHFIMGAPGVMISGVTVSGVTVNTGKDCFKQGDMLIISGHGFGSKSSGQVIAYATQGPMPIELWTDTKIQFRVPTVAEAPRFFPQGSRLMILHGKDPTPRALYAYGPVFCGSNKKP